MLDNTKTNFIELLLSRGALKFGDFTLPSGNHTPYFFNIGEINNGNDLDSLSSYFANLIHSEFLESFDNNSGQNELPIIFGAAYKGIPLAATSVSKIYASYKLPISFACNRKEPKTHGEKSEMMGADINNRDVIIIDDVIAEGVTTFKIYEFLKKYNANVKGLVVILDREDKVKDFINAREKIVKKLKIPVYSILSFSEILTYTKSYEKYNAIYQKLLISKK